ncbi:MAG: CBS domain-containing protein [Candidatus Aenigmatarchaeota archaeon]
MLLLVNTTDILVHDLMKEPVSIREDTTIGEMLEIIKKEKIILVSVTDKNNTLIGTVTEYDLIKLVKPGSLSPLAGTVWLNSIEKSQKDRPVREIMNNKPVSISQNDSIDAALKTMSNYEGLRVLPVVDSENKLIGIIRIRDVFEKLFTDV